MLILQGASREDRGPAILGELLRGKAGDKQLINGGKQRKTSGEGESSAPCLRIAAEQRWNCSLLKEASRVALGPRQESYGAASRVHCQLSEPSGDYQGRQRNLPA